MPGAQRGEAGFAPGQLGCRIPRHVLWAVLGISVHFCFLIRPNVSKEARCAPLGSLCTITTETLYQPVDLWASGAQSSQGDDCICSLPVLVTALLSFLSFHSIHRSFIPLLLRWGKVTMFAWVSSGLLVYVPVSHVGENIKVQVLPWLPKLLVLK